MRRDDTVVAVALLAVVFWSNWVSAFLGGLFLVVDDFLVLAVVCFSSSSSVGGVTHGTETPLTYNFSEPLHCKAMLTSSWWISLRRF